MQWEKSIARTFFFAGQKKITDVFCLKNLISNINFIYFSMCTTTLILRVRNVPPLSETVCSTVSEQIHSIKMNTKET